MIIPTGADDPRMTTAKRQTLADFMYYSLCAGQTKAGPYGYSPLPLNLVQAGFDQLAKLKKADPAVDLTDRDVHECNNPTFDGKNLNKNLLAEIAPQPAACDKAGAGPCGTDTGTNQPSAPTRADAGDGTRRPAAATGDRRRWRLRHGRRERRRSGGRRRPDRTGPSRRRRPRSTPRPVRSSAGGTGRRRTSDAIYANPTELAADRPADQRPSAGWPSLELLALVLLPGLYVVRAAPSRRRPGSHAMSRRAVALAARLALAGRPAPAGRHRGRRRPTGRGQRDAARPTTAGAAPRRSTAVVHQRRRLDATTFPTLQGHGQRRPDQEPARSPAGPDLLERAPSPAAAGPATRTARTGSTRSTRSSSCSAAASTTRRCRRPSSCAPETCWTARSPSARQITALGQRGDLDPRPRTPTRPTRSASSGLTRSRRPRSARRPTSTPYFTHLTPFVAAKGTVYPACDADHMPPEAAVGAAFPPAESRRSPTPTAPARSSSRCAATSRTSRSAATTRRPARSW